MKRFLCIPIMDVELGHTRLFGYVFVDAEDDGQAVDLVTDMVHLWFYEHEGSDHEQEVTQVQTIEAISVMNEYQMGYHVLMDCLLDAAQGGVVDYVRCGALSQPR